MSACCERDVGAALDVGGASARIVDGLAVDRDAHEIQTERILRLELARQRRDVDAIVVVELGDLVVDDLHDDMRRLALNEARVDDVVRVHVAASLELDLLRRELHVGCDVLHRAARACGREADVVAVGERRAALEPFVARVADEAQPRIHSAFDVGEAAAQQPGETGRHDGRAVLDGELGQRAPRRIVDAGDQLVAGRRAELRLVGQLLQRIVVPELDLDTAIQRTPLRRRVGPERARRAAAVAVDRRRRQIQRLLHGQRDAARLRAREADVVAVDALVALARAEHRRCSRRISRARCGGRSSCRRLGGSARCRPA